MGPSTLKILKYKVEYKYFGIFSSTSTSTPAEIKCVLKVSKSTHIWYLSTRWNQEVFKYNTGTVKHVLKGTSTRVLGPMPDYSNINLP